MTCLAGGRTIAAMPKMKAPRERLAQLMEDRRLELAMTWTAVATAANVSTEALRTARFTEANIAPLTKRGIERAMEWKPGSVDRILDGGEPEMLDQQRTARPAPPEEGAPLTPPLRLETLIDLEDDDAKAFVDRVVADSHLVEEARAHLLYQYGLLRRIPAKSQPGDTDVPPLRAVAEHGDPADRAELRRLAREAREGYEAQTKGSGDHGDDHR